VWFVDGRVAKSDIIRSLVHRWEGEKSEVALKVGVRHQQGGVRGERARWCLYAGRRVMRERGDARGGVRWETKRYKTEGATRDAIGETVMARHTHAAAEQSTTRDMPQHRQCTEDGRCMCIDDAGRLDVNARGKKSARDERMQVWWESEGDDACR
jgi:hypothetical protein